MELKIVNFPNYRWHGSEYLQMICTEFKNNILTFIPVEKEYFNHDPMFGPVIIRCSPCIWDTYAFEIVETECATEIFLDVENDFISSDFACVNILRSPLDNLIYQAGLADAVSITNNDSFQIYVLS